MKYINYFLQIFLVRLTRCQQRVITEIKPLEVSLNAGGSFDMGCYVEKSHTEQWYSLQGWIVPFTGWYSDFKYIGRNWFIKLTKPVKK